MQVEFNSFLMNFFFIRRIEFQKISELHRNEKNEVEKVGFSRICVSAISRTWS